MIGFKPNTSSRVTVRNCQGHKVGYLASVNGRQVFQSANGHNVAVILRWKQSPNSRVGSNGREFHAFGRISGTTMKIQEVIERAKTLIEWMPKCSPGSSGHIRRVKLEEALEQLEAAWALARL